MINPSGLPALFPDSAVDVVAIASSMGGPTALTVLLRALPASFPAAIVIAQHVSRFHSNHLAQILNKRSALHIKEAEHGERLQAGYVYIAPSDQHLLVTRNGCLALSHAPHVHFTRPSAEPLFASVAACCGSRVIAIVLTGADSDGSTGVTLIKEAGGIVLVQDSETSENFSMPHAAIATGTVDAVLPITAIAPALLELVQIQQVSPHTS